MIALCARMTDRHAPETGFMAQTLDPGSCREICTRHVCALFVGGRTLYYQVKGEKVMMRTMTHSAETETGLRLSFTIIFRDLVNNGKELRTE